MDHRDVLRREIRARRSRLSVDERRAYAHRIAHHLTRSHLFHNARRIAGYVAVRGEADPHLILEEARRRGKRTYLPVLSPVSDGRLWFATAHDLSTMRPNRFGIPEPHWIKQDLLHARQLDLVLTPLVGFDPHGNRLGMGGGFYDRSFAFLNDRRHHRRPLLIGCAYDLQQVDKLDRQDWDVPLNGIVTESGLRLFDD